MKSRGVGFGLPASRTTRSRSACSPVMPASSASVNGSSSPFFAKSKLSTSDSRHEASIGLREPSM